MDLYEAIDNRVSVRRYEDRPIPDDVLRRVLDAGRRAPSARNQQAWKFIAVRRHEAPELFAKVADACEQGWQEQAAVIVAVVSTEPDRVMYCGVPAGPVDCAIAVDHMSLAAVAEGLGHCWIGHFRQDDVRELLAVPEPMEVIELMTLGYPAGPTEKDKPRKSFDEVVSFERFA